MGFGISKSKSERTQERKFSLTAKTSKNRNLSNKNSTVSATNGLEGKSIEVLPQFTEGQSVETLKPNRTLVDFENKGMTTAWESAEEPVGAEVAGIYTGEVETMVPVSESPEYHSSHLDTKEDLKIQELSEDENEELKTDDKASPASPLMEHDSPLRCGTFDEAELFPSTERDVMNRINEVSFGRVIGDKDRKPVEDLIANAAAGLASFAIPRVPRLVTVGLVRTGFLGLGELSQATGLRDMDYFAKNELRAKQQENYKALKRYEPLQNYRKSSFENRFDVPPKDECLDIQRAYAEVFMEGKKSGTQEATDRKDTADQWVNSSSYFCPDSESSSVRTDCRGDFIIALSREMAKIGRDLCPSPEAGGKLDCSKVNACDQSDTESSGFPMKSFDETGTGANVASDALPSKRGVVFVDVPARQNAEYQEFDLANFKDFYGNSATKSDSTQNRSAINSFTLHDQSPVFREDTTDVSHLNGEANVQAEIGAEHTTGKGEGERGDGKCLPSSEAVQCRKDHGSSDAFSKEWDDFDFNLDASGPTVVGPQTGCDEHTPFNADGHATRFSKTFGGRDSSEDGDRSATDFYGQKVSMRGHFLP